MSPREPVTPDSLRDPHGGHPPHSFDVVDSETLYEGAIFALRGDRVRMPGGRVATREKVEHYGAVAIAALVTVSRATGMSGNCVTASARLVGMPSAAMYSDARNSRSELLSVASPSPKREKGVRPAPFNCTSQRR